jgi:hypothetical protein
MLHTLLPHPPRLDHSNCIGKERKFGTNILLSTLFSNTLILCPSLNIIDQVSHPYRIRGKIIVLYILIFLL